MTKTILAKTSSGEIQLTISIPKSLVKETYEKVLDELTKNADLPGFRKGKAPKKLVEEKTDKAKIYEHVLEHLIPEAYLAALKEHNLKPIISPKVELLKAKEDEDWEIRVTTCEEPEVSLGDYKEEIRKTIAPTKLWTPNKKTSATEDTETAKESSEEEKTQKVIQKLLEVVKVTLPEMLIEDGVNRSLSNLINQTNTLGLTIDQYLASIGKSADILRSEYREKVASELKLQFSLDKIAEEEKIEVTEKEVGDLISAAGDEKVKERLNTPFERSIIKGVLSRRKALDFLAKI